MPKELKTFTRDEVKKHNKVLKNVSRLPFYTDVAETPSPSHAFTPFMRHPEPTDPRQRHVCPLSKTRRPEIPSQLLMPCLSYHRQDGDNYLIIDGGVYNVSTFASMHPGGEQILNDLAGQDVSETFYGLHRQEVLDKYRPRLLVGYTEDADIPEDDGLTQARIG